MERVIYLESDEEITSVLDKLKKIEENSVILVIPKNATILQSLVNLKLLAKKAIDLKKEIALVTTDKIGRNLASLAGLSVYADLKEKSKITPKTPQLPPPEGVVVKTYTPSLDRMDEPKISKDTESSEPAGPPPSAKPLRSSFQFPVIPFAFWGSVFASFIVVFSILFFLLSRAIVTLQVKTESYNQSTEIIVDQKASEIDFENRILPGRPEELEKEEIQTKLATGKKNIGGKSKGTIIITNSYKNPDGSGSDFSLKAGTEFKDKKTGKIFLSDSAVTVPRLKYDPDTGQPISGTASVKVTAKEPGESYNIGPSLFSIPNLGVSSVYGTSSENMTGGYDKFVSVVSDGDIEKARDEISKDLFNKAKEELKSRLKKGQKLLEGGVFEEILEASSLTKVGTQASEFQMKVKIKISTLIVEEKEYKELLSKILESSLPSDKRLVSTDEDRVELSTISYDATLGIMRLKATVTTSVAPKIDEERIKDEIAKKTQEEAISYIKSLNEIEDVKIKTRPFWAKKLPQADKIKIKIEP